MEGIIDDERKRLWEHENKQRQFGAGLDRRTFVYTSNEPKGFLSDPLVFVGGGQEYYGETAARDKRVVELLAARLSRSLPNDVQIVYGGMPGIPEDFCKSFGQPARVLAVVSSEQTEKFIQRDTGFDHIAVGETQEKRRLGVVRLQGYRCAIFVQGGKYSTHEIKLFKERGDVPIVAYWGSGGASGGSQPYEGWTFQDKPEDIPLICSTDPAEDPEKIAEAMENEVLKHF